jgi:hypothetical protein
MNFVLRHALCNANLDFVCITETWLKDHIVDNIVSVSGYNIIRQDRKIIDHGGICMYVRDSIRFKVLHDLMDENFEVLWVQIFLQRLPRGVPSVIVGIVYHPPSASDALILDFLYESILKIEAQFPDSGILLLGDFTAITVVSRPAVSKLRLDLVFSEPSINGLRSYM